MALRKRSKAEIRSSENQVCKRCGSARMFHIYSDRSAGPYCPVVGVFEEEAPKER